MLSNYILQTTSAPGTGTASLIAAPTGRRNFNSKFTTGQVAFYFLDDGTQQEWGYGTLTTGTPDTLSRDTVLGNSSGTTSKLNFTGLTRMYNDLPAEQTVYKNNSGIVALPLTTITEPATGTSTLTLIASGSSGINIKMTGNGATTPNKYIRVVNGLFQIVNSGYTAVPFSLTDTGALTLTGALTATGITGTSLTISSGSTGVQALTCSTLGAGAVTCTTIGASAGITCTTIGATSGITCTTLGASLTVTASGQIQGGTLVSVGSIYAGAGGAGGFQCRTGLSGSTQSYASNMAWNGSAMLLYVDNVGLGSISVSSDVRYKHQIQTQTASGLDRVNALRPVSYRWQNKSIFVDDGVDREGLIAQEVGAVIPSAMDGDPNGDNPVSVNVLPVVSVLIKALQELSAIVDAQNARIAALEAKLP